MEMNFDNVRTPEDIVDALKALRIKTLELGLYDPACVVSSIDAAISDVLYNIEEMEAIKAGFDAEVAFNLAERDAGRMFNADLLR